MIHLLNELLDFKCSMSNGLYQSNNTIKERDEVNLSDHMVILSDYHFLSFARILGLKNPLLAKLFSLMTKVHAVKRDKPVSYHKSSLKINLFKNSKPIL